MIFLAFCFAFAAFVQLPDGGALIDTVYPWIYSGALHVDIALRVDPLSGVMIMVITGVGFLIHVYSVGYMDMMGDLRVCSIFSPEGNEEQAKHVKGG